jgi:molecular chaperone GrpE
MTGPKHAHGGRWRGFGKLKAVDTTNPEPNDSGVSEGEQLPVETAEARVAALTAERDQLAAAKADIEDRMLRARAEFDNVRRRGDRDRAEFLLFANMDLVKELLPVVDDFERALRLETTDGEYAKGIELIYQGLIETLKKFGLEPIETTGRLFDPHLHQAVDRVVTEDVEDMAILSEYQRGYNFKGKLLRPAMVRVAVRPS